MLNYYRVLDVDPRATQAEIKSARRERARETHPDHGGDAEAFDQVTQAYSTLCDDQKRADWENAYRRAANARGATVCEACFTVQARTADPACRACGEPWPVAPQSAPRAKTYSPRLERLKSDVLERLGDAAIDVGARIGDELADTTITTVQQTLDRLAKLLGRTRRAKP